ncbi:MAG: ATP synthase F0F1 subunit delta [Gracilibacter sp. BRH_c7a]|nr:MAG: ATP synthase F0F1 subunit delta [Gracilibacter sp. BRH_c7a]
MLSGALARRYAQALFELAIETSVLDQIDTEMKTISEIFRYNKELKYLLNHPNVDDESKKDILEKIFEKRISDVTKHFLYLLIDRRRHNLLELIQREFTRLADKALNIVEAKVISATELNSSHEERLKKVISNTTGKNVRLITEVNSELIGGAKLQIGDCVMDGSIATALCKLREEMRKSSYKPQQEVGVS